MEAAERWRSLAHCRTSPSAVVLTLWPSGRHCIDIARAFIASCGAKIVSEHSIEMPIDEDRTSRLWAQLLTNALYDGEEWLESNCWYSEQPLEELGIGLSRPSAPWAGTKWKAALCFRESAALRVFVLDVKSATRSLWSEKYGVRAAMSRHSGNAGNSCMHLTDDQTTAMRGGRRHGLDCNSSYAFACARALLHPHSLSFLRSLSEELETLDELSGVRMAKYCAWLSDVTFDDGAAAPPPM